MIWCPLFMDWIREEACPEECGMCDEGAALWPM